MGDVKMFVRLVEEERKRRGLSNREAAKEIGVSHTTLNQLGMGKPMEIDTAAKICKWLGVPLSTAIGGEPGDAKAIAAIATVLHTAPELQKVFVAAADEMEQGRLRLEDFKQIVDFAAYVIDKRRVEVSHGADRDTGVDHQGS